MSVSLSPDVEAIVSSHVSSGDYASAAEMVSAAIRLLDRRKREKKRQVEKLRSMLQEAIDQADRAELLDGDEVFDEILRELDEMGSVSP
jgi:putative addiction module CopG family antidote